MTNRVSTVQRPLPGGFTLIELMVVIAVLAIVLAIALPTYERYVQTSREGALLKTMATIEVFQEDFRLRTGAYATTGLNNTAAITAAIGWEPQRDDGATYCIVAASDGYDVIGRDNAGVQVCRRFPANQACTTTCPP
jgi:type IV pilus assembly protein PilE